MVGSSFEPVEDLGANGHTEFYVDPPVDGSIAHAFLCDVHAVSRLWNDAVFRAMVPWDVTAVSHSLDVVASLGCGLSCCPGLFLVGCPAIPRMWSVAVFEGHSVWDVADFSRRWDVTIRDLVIGAQISKTPAV